MQRPTVKVIVLGDAGAGKTSLITAATAETYQQRPVPVLPATRFPLAGGELLIHDTSSSPADAGVVDAAIGAADVAVLCLDVTSPAGLPGLGATWMPRIQQLRPDLGVILACTKDDLQGAFDAQSLQAQAQEFTTTWPQASCFVLFVFPACHCGRPIAGLRKGVALLQR